MLNQMPDQLCAEFPGAAEPPITVARIGLGGSVQRSNILEEDRT